MKTVTATLLFVVLLLLASPFPGCSRNDGATLEFWTLQLSPTFDAYFRNCIGEYERLHPGITVKWVDVPYDAAVQKLMASVAAGNAPDVVNLSADFLAKFASLHAFADLRSHVPADSVRRFLPSALAVCRNRDSLIALPWYLNTYVLIYNTDLLRKAGMSPKDIPRTFDELAAFVRTYKDRTGRFALFWNIGKDSYLPTLIESEGVGMTDSAVTHATFNSPRGIRLVDVWVQLYRQGYLQRESIISSGTRVIEAYLAGQVDMVFTGPVFLGRVKSNAPSIFAVTDIAPTPVGMTRKQDLATMVFTVMASSRHPKEAADFALFLLNAKNQLDFSRIEPTYPSLTASLDDPFFTTEDGTLEARARIVGARELKSAQQLGAYKAHPEYVRLHDIFDEAIQDACLGRKSTAEALNDAARAWDAILSGSGQ